MISVVLMNWGRAVLFADTVRSMTEHDRHNLHVSVMQVGVNDETLAALDTLTAEGRIDQAYSVRDVPAGYLTFMEGVLRLTKKHEYLLLTADDYRYRPGWSDVAQRWLAAARLQVSHITLDTEPLWHWNTIRGVHDAGGVRALLRATAPGANWMMPWESWLAMEPVYYEQRNNPTADHVISAWAWRTGRVIGALDLVEHTGAKQSTCGTQAYDTGAAVDPVLWGIEHDE